jgi:CheY-like chemotaxis protein
MLDVLFTHKGCSVLAAESATEAIRLAEMRLPGIVISDLSMPEMDGYQLLARLRCIPGMEQVPAIALSGYAMDEDRDRALAAGYSVHMAKPVNPEELFAVIQQLTQKR